MARDFQVVADADGLTPEWLTDVLQGYGCLAAGGRVTHVRTERLDAGLASRNLRLSLTYSGNRESSPDYLVAKLASPHEGTRTVTAASGAYLREVYFYSRVAGRDGKDAGIRIPECYHASINTKTQDMTILLEDFAPSKAGDHASGFSYDECVEAVEAAAAMHARWWNDPKLDTLRLLRPAAQESFNLARKFYASSLGVARDKFGPMFAGSNWQLLDRLDYGAAMEASYGGPRTLVHGDFHAANIFLRFPNSGPAAIDWQLMQGGLGVLDVARLVLLSLNDGDRTEELVAAYSKALAANGVDYSLESALRDFAAMTLCNAAQMVIVIAGVDMDSEEGQRVATPILERLSSALGRLNPSDLVPPLVSPC